MIRGVATTAPPSARNTGDGRRDLAGARVGFDGEDRREMAPECGMVTASEPSVDCSNEEKVYYRLDRRLDAAPSETIAMEAISAIRRRLKEVEAALALLSTLREEAKTEGGRMTAFGRDVLVAARDAGVKQSFMARLFDISPGAVSQHYGR